MARHSCQSRTSARFVVGIMGMLKFGNSWAALRIMRRMEEHRLSVPNQCAAQCTHAGLAEFGAIHGARDRVCQTAWASK